MNFLAHIFLSSDNELLTIGNFAGDAVKGKDFTHFPAAMQAGIQLHREIDTFTDAHPVVRQSTKRLHKNYSHYSGIIVDIFYDHFLAKNWERYSDIPLSVFVEDFYRCLNKHFDLLPARIKVLTPFMIKENWLLSYTTMEGIQKVLNGMNRRTRGRSKMNRAITELQDHYQAFEDDFTLFFDDLVNFSTKKRLDIEKQLKI